jgi:hypothetical protein
MRVTISHSKTREAAVQAVDRAMDDVFRTLAVPPLVISNPHKTWNGSDMTFALNAQMGFLKNSIKGTVQVTDCDITIDADLGLLNRLFPDAKVRAAVESRVKGYLA